VVGAEGPIPGAFLPFMSIAQPVMSENSTCSLRREFVFVDQASKAVASFNTRRFACGDCERTAINEDGCVCGAGIAWEMS